MHLIILRCVRTPHFALLPTSCRNISCRKGSIFILKATNPSKRHASTINKLDSAGLDKVNGPSSTRPPPLDTPSRRPDQSFFPSYLFSIGKAYLTFYKTGVKAIYTNYKATRPVQAALDAKYHGSLTAAAEDGYLTRTKLQLLVRSWHDLKRVPAFALIFAICGELTPLIVVAVSSVVPYTCRIPRQIESDRRTLESRRKKSFRDLTSDYANDAGGLDRRQLLHISWSLGLGSSWWDWVNGPPTTLLRRRVKRRMEYLRLDDGLIERDGGVKDLNIEEVKLALEERGMDVLGRNDKALRSSLRAWLNARHYAPIEKLLLTRPSVWPVEKT